MPRLPFGDMGPVEVTWAPDLSDELILTPHLGAITLRLEDEIANVEEEGFGSNAVDGVITGSVCELEVPMARSTLAQLAVITHGELDGFGNLLIPAFVGCGMYEESQPVLVKPVCNNVASTIRSEWILLYKCYPYRSFSLEFSRDAQRFHLAKFKVFVSQESATFGKFYQYGYAIV